MIHVNIKDTDKMFVIRKYVKAKDALSAIKKDRKTQVHEVWIDDEWKKNQLASAIGFEIYNKEED